MELGEFRHVARVVEVDELLQALDVAVVEEPILEGNSSPFPHCSGPFLNSDSPLDRVAELAGFVDGPHLSRVFRLHTGRSPGQYRVEFRSPRPETRCASG